jgi:hypothetical protein
MRERKDIRFINLHNHTITYHAKDGHYGFGWFETSVREDGTCGEFHPSNGAARKSVKKEVRRHMKIEQSSVDFPTVNFDDAKYESGRLLPWQLQEPAHHHRNERHKPHQVHPARR